MRREQPSVAGDDLALLVNRTGIVHPQCRIDATISATWLGRCRRAFRAFGASRSIGQRSIAEGRPCCRDIAGRRS